MAEIEHFCDPAEKTHPKFGSVRDTELLLYSAADQMDGKSAELHSIGQAVDKVTQKLTVYQHLLTKKSLMDSACTLTSTSECGHLLMISPYHHM